MKKTSWKSESVWVSLKWRGEARIIYFQVISYSNVNNEEDDTLSIFFFFSFATKKRVECNKTCFLSPCKIELQNELTIFKREYYKKRVNNVKKEKARDMYLLCSIFFSSPSHFVFHFSFFLHHLFIVCVCYTIFLGSTFSLAPSFWKMEKPYTYLRLLFEIKHKRKKKERRRRGKKTEEEKR